MDKSEQEITGKLDEILALAHEVQSRAIDGKEYMELASDVFNRKLPVIYKLGTRTRLFAVDYVLNNFDKASVSLYDRDNLVLSLLGEERIDYSSSTTIHGGSLFRDGISLLTDAADRKARGCLLSHAVLTVFLKNIGIEETTRALNRLRDRAKGEERDEIDYVLVKKYGMFKRDPLESTCRHASLSIL